jgi:pre-rRNA-processing protein TSR2
MAITRAAAAKSAFLANNPEAVNAFKSGVSSALRQWTALELAVHHQWGGDLSKEKAEYLLNEILSLFLGPEKIYKDDISFILEDFLEGSFNTICEDGSPDELGDLFVLMWRQCLEKDFSAVNKTIETENKRINIISNSKGIEAGDEMIDEDEDDLNDEKEIFEQNNNIVNNIAINSVNSANMNLEGINSEVVEVEDGWEVAGKKKKNKNVNKNNQTNKSYKI